MAVWGWMLGSRSTPQRRRSSRASLPAFSASVYFLLLLGQKPFPSREDRGRGFGGERCLAGDTPPSDFPDFRQKVGAAVSQRACGANVSYSGVIVSGGLEERGGAPAEGGGHAPRANTRRLAANTFFFFFFLFGVRRWRALV